MIRGFLLLLDVFSEQKNAVQSMQLFLIDYCTTHNERHSYSQEHLVKAN